MVGGSNYIRNVEVYMRKVKAVIETCSMVLENYIRNVEEFFFRI